MCNRFRYFLMNCKLSFLVFLCSAIVVGQDLAGIENPHFYFAGAWGMVLPALLWGVAEMVAFYRQARWLEQLLGVWCGLLAAVFGALGGYLTLQIPWDAPDPGTDILGAAVVLLIGCYLALCCYCRCRKPRVDVVAHEAKAAG